MKKIAVVGLGLIGTSLLKALLNKGYELYGVSKNPETVKKALLQNLVKEASVDFSLLKKADFIFIAVPIEKTIETIEKVKKVVSEDAIVADLASVKEFVIDYVNNLDVRLNFVSLHPMAGTENRGFDSAEEDLFEGSKWAVIPSNFAKKESIDALVQIIEQIGAKPIFTDAKTHDKSAALISHMPMILAQALFLTANDELSKKLAASGFRDMTRLAATNPQMAKDMMEFNKKNIIEAVKELKQQLDVLLEDYESKNLDEIVQQRKNMYSMDGKNNSK